ncbi:transposase [Vreelandella rituensis]|uniref:transposase n=1 Tax=Vreelandella rituensis TaxID=2282306 RepID=UPI001F4347AB|nr:transposase [Halomonas rituensis]
MKNAVSSSHLVSRLQRQVQAQQEEIAQLHHLMEKKEAQWEAAKQSLYEQFRLARERQFGPSIEKYGIQQGDLLINEAELAVDEEDSTADDAQTDAIDETFSEKSDGNAPAPAKKRTRGGRVALPPELPRVEVFMSWTKRNVAVPRMAPSSRSLAKTSAKSFMSCQHGSR